MGEGTSRVWYVSYGSNLLRERFCCYILGGTPPGSAFHQPGCVDCTLPERDELAEIPGRVSFRGSSRGWHGGGVCFLDHRADGHSIGRKHLVTLDQFINVTEQENAHKPGSTGLLLDFDELREAGEVHLPWQSWYSRLVWLGESEGLPMLTFINAADRVMPENSPSEAYLLTLVRGMREMGLDDGFIRTYLSPSVDHLGGWITEASNWTAKSLDWDALLAR